MSKFIRLSVMIFIVLPFRLFAETAMPADAANDIVESSPDIMLRLDVEETRNIPYVSTQLDQVLNASHLLDIYQPANAPKPLPVILYVHGGGWAFGDKKDVHLLPHFFATNGFAFVSVNYRLRWDYKVYDQIVDLLTVIQWLKVEGEEHNLDGENVILMGIGSGGHLVSLVVADDSIADGEGIEIDNVKAVVSMDSISYDIPRLMKELGSFLQRQQHELIFSRREEVWQAASPITHVSKGMPPFALIHNPESEAATLQARNYAKALSEHGVPVIIIPGKRDSDQKLDQQIGRKDSIATGALMAFIRSQI